MTSISLRRPQAAGREQKLQQRKRATLLSLLGPVTLLLLVFFIVPIVVLFSYSAFHFDGIRIVYTPTFDAYPQYFGDAFHWDVLGRTLSLAFSVTLMTLLIGYPTAYAISRLKSQRAIMAMYFLVFSPFLTSVVIRAFGWMIVLGEKGVINYVLLSLRIIDQPIRLIYNTTGVSIALVHVFLPFAVFPILSVLNQTDPALKEAANDLGADRWVTFRRVTWPLSLPGLWSGAQTTFVLAASAFATPSLLGGGRVTVLSRNIYESIVTRDWPMAAVQGIVLLAISLTILFISNIVFRLLYRAAQEQAT